MFAVRNLQNKSWKIVVHDQAVHLDQVWLFLLKLEILTAPSMAICEKPHAIEHLTNFQQKI